MQFKYDTKPTYTVITPIYDIVDANLTANLTQQIADLTANGSENYIIDLENCDKADITSLNKILLLHEQTYEQQKSLVFIGLSEEVAKSFKLADEDRVLNIAPTLIEAVDIISMEILERDILNEE